MNRPGRTAWPSFRAIARCDETARPRGGLDRDRADRQEQPDLSARHSARPPITWPITWAKSSRSAVRWGSGRAADDALRRTRSCVTEVAKLSQEFDVVCLGGGVAGEAIAAGLQDSGLTLAVVERELVGGECPYWGCIPSKTLLRSGETLSEAGRARVLAASRVEWTVDFPKVSKRVLWMARDLDDSRPAAAMEATGARLFRGEGKLTDLRTVAVGRRAADRAARSRDRQRQHRGDPADPRPRHRRVLDQPPGGDSEGTAGVAGDPRRRRDRRRARPGVRAPRLQGDRDRSRTDVPRPRRARSRRGAPAAPRGGRHHADDRRPRASRSKSNPPSHRASARPSSST